MHDACHLTDDSGVVHLAVVFGVGNAQATAQIELLGLEATGLLDRCDEAYHDVSGLREGLGVKDLRADVAMEAAELDVLKGQCESDHLHSLTGLNGRAELGVHATRDDGFVGMGVNTGRDAKKNSLDKSVCGGVSVHGAKLVGVIHYERAHAHVHSVLDIPLGLVVAVEVDTLGREARRTCGVKLTARNAIHAHTFLGGDAVNTRKAQSLRGVQRQSISPEALASRREIGAHLRTNGVLVHDVSGRAEASRQFNGVRAADAEMSCGVDR